MYLLQLFLTPEMPTFYSETEKPQSTQSSKAPSSSSAIPAKYKRWIVDDPTDTNCPQCGTFPTQKCLEYHRQVAHNKFCDVCNTRLDHLELSELMHHGMLHTDVKPFQCEVCYKLFGSKSGLFIHQIKNVMCTMCSKIFQPGRISSHMKASHGIG
ncbi:unnamed protein product [Owenia fusiformis]|uniref:C2H2-type domain-containing protein n=1 Tax=Owenia fusiformis TaxID=6347 RepID=A0A8S4N6U5_OWEFU|nr:unnamed protein product [Owenia fusiformis]